MRAFNDLRNHVNTFNIVADLLNKEFCAKEYNELRDSIYLQYKKELNHLHAKYWALESEEERKEYSESLKKFYERKNEINPIALSTLVNNEYVTIVKTVPIKKTVKTWVGHDYKDIEIDTKYYVYRFNNERVEKAINAFKVLKTLA